MAKTQTQAAEQAAPEKTAEQTPVNYDVRIFGAKSSGTQRATASVNINGAFAVRGVKVLESNKGLFVAMPQYKVGSEYKALADKKKNVAPYVVVDCGSYVAVNLHRLYASIDWGILGM